MSRSKLVQVAERVAHYVLPSVAHQPHHPAHHQAQSLGRSLSRHYTSDSHLHQKGISNKDAERINKGLEAIVQEMKAHRALHHPYIAYLEANAGTGFTAAQFDVHRANYFFRTHQTIPSVARLIIAAAKNQDPKTLASAGKNIYEETGEGNQSLAHSLLLERSHNMHGAHVFGLSNISLRDSRRSHLVVPETQEFVARQLKLYTSPSYASVLGTGFAHEHAADPMLTKFYQTLFLPYQAHYKNGLFEQVSKYFNVHLEGVEERHALDAKEAVLRACKVAKDIDSVRKGAFGFLDAQAKLWDGMLVAVEKAGKIGKPVAPLPEAEIKKSHVSSLAATKGGQSR